MQDLPQKIGKYQVRGLIGRGAMGAVYLGHDPFIDRPVAIKVCAIGMGEGDVSEEIARKMFFNEAQAAGALDNPNILRIFDAGDANGKPYIVMEYVDGADTLRSYTKPGKLLPVKDVMRLMHQCAESLDYAHRRGVLHRDIKPANLILSKDGEVKIGDFGIAQRTQTEKTQVMGAMGTPMYMSPEQARDDTLTNQTDIYSLGVVMYELLAGKTPFKPSSLAALVRKIVSEDPVPIKAVRPDLPEAVTKIVARAMEKEPNNRYKTGAEMAADIAKLMNDSDRPPSELTEAQKFEAARALKFFNDFADDEVREVLEASSWEHYKTGDCLITEGTFEQSFFLIVSGDVSVLIGDTEIGRLTAGDCVGELGYLSRVKRTASVTATGNVSAMKIDSNVMEWASLSCQMRFSKSFQQILIERLSRTSLDLASCIGRGQKPQSQLGGS
jgi:serine/threonine protein kinase